MKKIIPIYLVVLSVIFFAAVYVVRGASIDISARIPSSSSCGNGVLDVGETCDDGALNGSCPASCSASCTRNSCGGTTYVGCNHECNESYICASWLTCYSDPLLGKSICRNPVVVNSVTCSQEDSVILNIRSFPEKRTPYSNPNYTLPGTLEIRTSNNALVTSTSFVSGNDGWAVVGISSSTFPSLPGIYNLEVKGISHLLKATTSINIINKITTEKDGNNQVDFTLYPTRYFADCPGRCFESFNVDSISGALLAGDVARPKNNYVNSLDFSSMAGDLYLSSQNADLNWDGEVNSLDFSISAFNIYRQGE